MDKKPNFKMRQTADVSFAHIPMRDRNLGDIAHSDLLFVSMCDGLTLRFPVFKEPELVRDHCADLEAFGFSKHLWKIIEMVRETGAEYVEFCADGEEYDELPQFDDEGDEPI